MNLKQNNHEHYSENVAYKVDNVRHPYVKTTPFKYLMIYFLFNETNFI